MAIRRPPDDYPPRIVRRGDSSAPRVVRYEEPKRSFFRRVLRMFTRPYVAIPAVVIFALCATVLIYYWVVFSGRIDNLLRGEVFTRSAGIYAAPKQIRTGQNISEEDLIAYLRRAGYVERNQQADSNRGRYTMSGSMVDIDPGADSLVDNARPYPQVRVEFNRTGKSVASLTDRQNGGHLE